MRGHVIMTEGRDAGNPIEHMQLTLPSLFCRRPQVSVFAIKHISQKVNPGANTSLAFLPSLVSYQVYSFRGLKGQSY